jgi:hypothetical protein
VQMGQIIDLPAELKWRPLHFLIGSQRTQ